MITKSNKNDIYAPTIGNALAVYIELLSGKVRLQDQRGEDVNLAEFFDTKNMSILGLSGLTSGDAEETDVILVRNSNEWKTMTVQDAQSLFGGGNPLSPALIESKDIVYDGTSLFKIYFYNDGDSEMYAGIESLSCPSLVSITGSESLTGDVLNISSSDLIDVQLPLLETISGDVQISSASIRSINMASLLSVEDMGINSNSLADGLFLDSLESVGALQITNNNGLLNLDLPSLLTAGAISVENCNSVTAFNAAGLQSTTTGFLAISDMPSLTSIDLSSFETGLGITFNNLSAIETISLPSLTQIGRIEMVSNNSLSLFSAPSLLDAGTEITIFNNASLENIIFTGTLPEITEFSTYNLSNNALTEMAVDNILAAAVAQNLPNRTLTIDGGTNSAPSVLGATFVATLISRGWSVTTN